MSEATRIAQGLTVVDLGLGMAAALVAKQLAEAGARVIRVAPESGDPFDDAYPAHRAWRANSEAAKAADLPALLARADVCIVGGEDWPGLEWSFDAEAFAARNERLVVLRIKGYASASAAGAPAVDLLVQARSGLVWEQFTERPIAHAMPLPTYGAALLGMIGIWAALVERESSGLGQCVVTSLQQGVAVFWAPQWMTAEKPDAEFRKVSPKGVRHLIFQCADGGWVHFVMGIPGAVAKLYGVLGIDAPVDPDDRGNPKTGAALDQYFGNLPLIAPYVRKRQRHELLQAAWDAGLAAEPVLMPGEAWDHPQVIANGTIQTDASGARSVGACAKVWLAEADEAAATTPRSNEPSRAPDGPPLAGLRVVDLGSFVAGPYTSRLLANLGAEVIKVEALGGSVGRGIVSHTVVVESGKRSLAVDMKTPEGMDVVRRLCARADVVTHNFRVGVAPRLQVDSLSLRKLNPGIVTLETTAYGLEGPKARNSGFDMVMQALCGHEARSGGEGNPPLWIRVPTVDYGTGALGAVATLMAVYGQQRSGRAARAHASLLDSALFLMSELVQSQDRVFHGAPVLNRDGTGFHPAQSLYQTCDAWVAVAARDEAMAGRLAGVLNLGDLGARATWAEQARECIATRIREHATADLLALLARADVWAERCVDGGLAAMLADPHARDDGLLIDLDDPRYGRITGAQGPLMRFSRSRVDGQRFKSFPGVGADTRQLLGELGFADREIDTLMAQRAIA